MEYKVTTCINENCDKYMACVVIPDAQGRGRVLKAEWPKRDVTFADKKEWSVYAKTLYEIFYKSLWINAIELGVDPHSIDFPRVSLYELLFPLIPHETSTPVKTAKSQNPVITLESE